MEQFFWFVLGALSYKFLTFFIDVGRKANFINDVKHLAFHLIGRAYEELMYTRALKFKTLENLKFDTQQTKALENEDEEFIREWRHEAVRVLNSSVPIVYQNTLDIQNWSKLMSALDNYYKDKFKNGEDRNIRED